MKVLIFDTETTGLSKSKIISKETMHLWPFIVQFSYIIFDTKNYRTLKMYDKIIKLKPYNVISQESTNLHGITNEISESEGINLIDTLNEFLIDIKKVDLIVAHNMDFDISMVKIELLRLINEYQINENTKQILENYFNVIINLNNLHCTMRKSVDLCQIERENVRGKYFKFPSLSELHVKLFNIEPNNLHNSLNDILITLRCFIKLTHNRDVIKYNKRIKNLVTPLL